MSLQPNSLSENASKALIKNTITMQDKLKLILQLEDDKLTWTHFKSYRGPTSRCGGEPLRKEWTYKQYWHDFQHELCLGIKRLPYMFTEIWQGNIEPAYTFIDMSDNRKMLILTFHDQECRMIYDHGKNFSKSEPLEVDPIILRDWNEVPKVESIEDYVQLVAPFCEALLKLFIELFKKQPERPKFYVGEN